MRMIPLTKGRVAIVDDEDFEALNRYKWCVNNPGGKHFYAIRTLINSNGRKTCELMHRAITGAKKGECVDHINGDGLDNRRHNLRLASHQQNQWNRVGRRGRIIAKGVYRNKSKKHPWSSRIRVGGKVFSLGSYPSITEASKAYDRAAIHHFGAFAKLNQTEPVALDYAI